MISTILLAVWPSHRSGIVPFLLSPFMIFSYSLRITLGSEPVRTFVPPSMVTGLSVLSLSVRQGIPR